MPCPFDYHAVAVSGKVGAYKNCLTTPVGWVIVFTPTDRPKSVRNRCVIDLFVALFVLSLCPFDISVGVGDFVIGLSQISSFLSLEIIVIYIRVLLTLNFKFLSMQIFHLFLLVTYYFYTK